MARLAGLSGREVVRALERLGFANKRQRGSHVVMRKETPEGPVGTVVPLHRELAEGTVRGILGQARITVEQFLTAL